MEKKSQSMRHRQLSETEAYMLEKAVREVLWKGKRKRTPFTLESLDVAVKDSTAWILRALGMYYPDA
jgi:hypothetical protein